MLTCARPQCKGAFPLQLLATTTQTDATEPDPAFIRRFVRKLDWSALVVAARVLGVTIPDAEPSDEQLESDADLLTNLQRLLFDIHVVEGMLVCPLCERHYPIRNGIPNMLLNETEV